jgi:hypothetical protein
MTCLLDAPASELFAPDIPMIYDGLPRQVRIDVFTFRELLDRKSKRGEKAAGRAREWLQSGATSHGWWDCVYDDWKSALAQIGFGEVDISFSGFWSQGDGASFTADVDLTKLIPFMANPPAADKAVNAGPDGKEDWRPWTVHKADGVASNPEFEKLLEDDVINECSMSITRSSSRYVHENTCKVDYEDNLKDGPIRDLWLKFVESVETLRKDVSQAIYKQLEEDHEYRTSDEALEEDAESNDYLFDSSGRII